MKNNKTYTFEKYFIITILMFAVIYILSIIKIDTMYQKNDSIKTEKIKEIDFNKKLSKILPKYFSQLEKKYIMKNYTDLGSEINKSVSKIFVPVYNNIPKFVDAHYTLKGEYSELLSMLQGKIGENFKKILYENSNFNNKLTNNIKKLLKENNTKINNDFKNMELKIIKKENLSNKNIKIFDDMIKEVQLNTKKRFDNEIVNIVRYSSTLASASVFVLSKTIAKTIAKKIALKLTSKAVLKYGAASATAIAGAEIGSVIPGYGTVIGGIVGGVVGWFSSDVVIISIDKYINKRNFEEKIKLLVKKQEENIKEKIKEKLIKYIKNNIKYRKTKLKNKIIINLIQK